VWGAAPEGVAPTAPAALNSSTHKIQEVSRRQPIITPLTRYIETFRENDVKRIMKAFLKASSGRQVSFGPQLRGAIDLHAAALRFQRDSAPSSGRRLVPALTTLVLAALVVFGTSTAFAADSPEYLRSFGPDGTSSSPFERARSVAVDQQSGAVYVIDGGNEGSLYKFDAEGHPLPFGGSAPYISGNKISLPIASCFTCVQVAVDSTSHDVYVTSENSLSAFHSDGEAAEFTAGPGTGTNSIGGFDALSGVAVDSNGAIYASDSSLGLVRIYAPSGEVITEFSAPGAGNLSVDPSGAVYVVGSEGVVKYLPSPFPVDSTTTYSATGQMIGSAQSNTVAVDPGTSDIYVGQARSNLSEGRIERYDESGNLLARFAGPEEEGEVTEPLGIAIVGASGRVFVADGPFDNTGFLSRVEIFGFIPGPPTIRSTSVADVSASSATLWARINPNSFETSYHFEYGLQDCAISVCASVPFDPAEIGAGRESLAVSQVIAGLAPETTYHFRVVAENSEGSTEGLDRTFTTQRAGLGFDLADDRAWEMVSPPDKNGALLQGAWLAHVQGAEDGSGLAYSSIGSIEAAPDGNRSLEPSAVLARRTPNGWRSKDISPPNAVIGGVAIGSQALYKGFSVDLSKAVLEPHSNTALSPGGASRAPYLRQNSEPPIFESLIDEGNLPPGTGFSQISERVAVGAVTPDLAHIGLSSEVPLVEGAPSACCSLYLWAGGEIRPVSVLPEAEGGTIVATDGFGSSATVHHAISDDGSRVFWSRESDAALYLRDMNAEESIRLDQPQPDAAGTGEERPVFQGGSFDGTVVYFTDPQQLTSGASAEGRDLYRCQIPLGSPAAGCTSLTDVSVPLAGENSEVLGLVSGMSEDGSTVYFVARGVLDEKANKIGDAAVSGKPNLYVWREGTDPRFIATLAERDDKNWGGGNIMAFELSAAASPDGDYLAFSSQRSLTRADNRDPESGELVHQVFRYDAIADRIDCLSCDPSGAAPGGEVAENRHLVDPRGKWNGVRVAAILPQPPINQVVVNKVLYNPRGLLDSGRVFFNAIDSLVPSDSNGEWDVYQYEPTGVGDCSASSGGPSIILSAGGCVSLISSGSGNEEAGFLDASATGEDVFFLTPAQLNEPDEDQELDVYDARVNGVPARLPSKPECLGEACQALAPAPNDPTPASAGFQGPGNVKHLGRTCPKGKRKVRRHGRTVCVRRKQHRHEKQHRRSQQGRRAEG
jgi:WD40-like Beta Propeller Repeat